MECAGRVAMKSPWNAMLGSAIHLTANKPSRPSYPLKKKKGQPYDRLISTAGLCQAETAAKGGKRKLFPLGFDCN